MYKSLKKPAGIGKSMALQTSLKYKVFAAEMRQALEAAKPMRITAMTVKFTWLSMMPYVASYIRENFDSRVVQEYVSALGMSMKDVEEPKPVFVCYESIDDGESSCDSIDYNKKGRVSAKHTIVFHDDGFVITGTKLGNIITLADHFCHICDLCSGQIRKHRLNGFDVELMNAHFQLTVSNISLRALYHMIVEDTTYMCHLNPDCVVVRFPKRPSATQQLTAIVFDDGHVLINAFINSEELLMAHEFITTFANKHVKDSSNGARTRALHTQDQSTRRHVVGPARFDYGKHVIFK